MKMSSFSLFLLSLLLLTSCIMATKLGNRELGRRGSDSSRDSTEEDETPKRLEDVLLKGYNRMARPVVNASAQMTIKFGVTLLNLFPKPESDQLDMVAWLKTEWHDDFLQWDPSDFGGVNVVRVPISAIWSPDMTLFNAMTPVQRLSRNLALVYSNGHVTWIPPIRVSSMCKFNASSGERQTCDVKIGSWTYDGNLMDVQFYNGDASVDISEYVGSVPVFHSPGVRNVKYYDCCPESYINLGYAINFQM